MRTHVQAWDGNTSQTVVRRHLPRLGSPHWGTFHGRNGRYQLLCACAVGTCAAGPAPTCNDPAQVTTTSACAEGEPPISAMGGVCRGSSAPFNTMVRSRLRALGVGDVSRGEVIMSLYIRREVGLVRWALGVDEVVVQL